MSMPMVIGRRRAIVAVGPRPGSTPITVPMKAPRKHGKEVSGRERDGESVEQCTDGIQNHSLIWTLLPAPGQRDHPQREG